MRLYIHLFMAPGSCVVFHSIHHTFYLYLALTGTQVALDPLLPFHTEPRNDYPSTRSPADLGKS